MPKTTYFKSESGKIIRVEAIDDQTEIVTSLPENFTLPEPPPEPEPEPEPPPLVPKKSDLKTEADRANFGREFGFSERKQKDVPCLLELKD